MESHDASPLDAAPEAAPEARDSFRSALFFLLFAVSLTLPNLVYSGFFTFFFVDQYRDFDFTGRNHVNIDSGFK